MNIAPAGADPETWTAPYAFERATDLATAEAELERQRISAYLHVFRLPEGRLQVDYRTSGPVDGVQSQLAGFAALSVAIIDWTSSLPAGSQLGTFEAPVFDPRSISAPIEGGEAVDAVEAASRSFLGTVFIILMFITILIYGMWVATGVATEKSSRVMELMISAASPRQLLFGKVVGIGGAGLTQYVAIVIPAVIVLAFQDQIALAVLGETGAGLPIGGLTIGLLLAYGAFFLMGFTLFAFVYAAVGSFVSRPDDLQTLSLPLSLLAMAGYVSALTVLLERWRVPGASRVIRAAVQPLRDARAADGQHGPALGGGAVGRDPAGHDRGRGARDGPHLRDRGAALRSAAGDPPVHRGRAARGLGRLVRSPRRAGDG